MIIDAQLLLSDAQALTNGTTVSTNTYDSGAAGNNILAGRPMAAMFTVDVAAALNDGDETYQIQLIQSANADLSSPDVLLETVTAALTKAMLVQGFKFAIPWPPSLKTKRYLGVRYILAGTTASITITASITPLDFVQNEQYYGKNYTISF